jgi:hypothetical protein
MKDLKKLYFSQSKREFLWSNDNPPKNYITMFDWCSELERRLFMAYIKGRSEGLTAENVLKYAQELNEFINNAIDGGIDFNFIEK